MKIIKEQIISIPEAKKIMKERKKQGDLAYEQKICLEYLEKAYKVPKTKIENIVNELGQIPILKPRHIALVVNNMPETEDEVKLLFAKERTNLKKDEIKKIAEIISKNK